VSDSEGSKQSIVFYNGSGELSPHSGGLPEDLIAFRPQPAVHHPVGWKKLGEINHVIHKSCVQTSESYLAGNSMMPDGNS
jgi:hypothetical protein